MKILNLNRGLLLKNLPTILEIEKTQMKDFPKWTKANYLLEKPRKFELSKIAIIEGRVCGFLIASQEPDTCRIHRIAVGKDFLRQGIGSKMLKEVANQAFDMGLKQIIAESLKKNTFSRFYLKNRFRKISQKEQKEYATRKSQEKQKQFLEEYSVFIKNE